ncbi:MAG: penicillin-binding transpeptidase domain-containing protein [Kibdelosporangium sp.]
MRIRARYIVLAVVLATALGVSIFVLRRPVPSTVQPPIAGPSVLRWADGGEITAPDAMLVQRARAELNSLGYSDDQLDTHGFTVELTIDSAVQNLAEQAVDAVLPGQPEDLRQALVAVDPRTGRILAYHGFHPATPGVDFAARWQNPGTAFLPFVMTASLLDGKGSGEVYDGTSPRAFNRVVVSNPAGAECQPRCSVGEAMQRSARTVFADIASNVVGTRAVARAAVLAGIPSDVGEQRLPLEGGVNQPPAVTMAIGDGDTQVRPMDLAAAYATFAANGTRHKPHLVARVVETKSGAVAYDGDESNAGSPAFVGHDLRHNANIARNVTETLLAPAPDKASCGEGVVCAGKSGSYSCPTPQEHGDIPVVPDHRNICATWMAGYTPQISTAVWVGAQEPKPLKAADGTPLTTAGPAGQIWRGFMDSYLKGRPAEPFPPLVKIGR